MNWSIQKKILILTIGLSIFTASVIFLFYSYKTTAVQNSNKKQNLLVQSNLIQATIDRFLQERLSDVLDLAQDSVLCSAQVSSIDTRIKSYISNHSYFESISVFDTGRVRLADTKDLEIGKQHSLITYWRRLPESSYVVDISRSESMKINVIHFGCKIYKNGKHVGYLVARMDAQKVNEIFNYVLQKENQFINIELLDSNGTTLFSDRKSTRLNSSHP